MQMAHLFIVDLNLHLLFKKVISGNNKIGLLFDNTRLGYNGANEYIKMTN